MFKRVLCPVTLNESMSEMLGCLAGLSKTGTEEVLLLHVESPSEAANGRTIREDDHEAMENWKKMLEESGLKTSYRMVTGIPWIEIVDIAEKENFSFIMMGSQEHSMMERFFPGGVTRNVLNHAKRPIFIYRLSNPNHSHAAVCREVFSKILFATDFSESSENCIPYIEQMLSGRDQQLLILHVQDLRNLKHAATEKIEYFNEEDLRRLDMLKEKFERHGFKNVMTLLTTGYSVSEILNYIHTENPSILVMGKKGKTNLREMLLGGVSETMLQRAPLPLFVVDQPL